MPEPDEEFLQKLREAFAIEAREHLQELSAGLLELESGAPPERERNIIETIFREAHSLKGAARSVDRQDIEAVCQAMESVFSRWKNEALHAGPDAFGTLSRATDFVDSLLAEPEADRKRAAAVVEQLRALETDQTAAPAAPPEPVVAAEPPADVPERAVVAETIRITTAKMDALLLQAEEMIAVKNTIQQRAAELHGLELLLENWHKEWARTGAELQRVRDRADGQFGVNAARLFDFLEWNHSYLRSLDHRLSALSKTAESDHRAVSSMVDGLLDEAKRMVMLPFATLLDSFPKQVRDLARDQGKEIDLVLRGREIEIDKRILEQMKDPLVHLVRNAADHGLESPQERAAGGKSARGELTIAVAQIDASKVEIVVADDGGGIDAAKVKASAVKAGTISAEDAAQRSDHDALQLIFHSGVSTSAMITEISGRGLGMAIVREKVEALGGHVEIETELGRGTTFRIELPVTLATFKGLLISAGGEQFILPITNVDRVMSVSREKITTVENKETISWNDRVLSLARLDGVLGLPPRENAGEQKLVQIVILSAGETHIAFVVDEVLSEHEVLVKPLQKPLVHVRNIAAATVLGSGRTVLILNVPDLLHSATESTGVARTSAAPSAAAKTKSLLVTDDSVTSRMLLKNILEAAGYEVKTAIDGIDAWTTLKTQKFDAVVSDVQMPRLDGFELTAKIRADKRLADLPVVLVTALESREHRERGVEVGANAYIVKSSFDQSNLLEVVRRLI